jgi:hypothetical protein
LLTRLVGAGFFPARTASHLTNAHTDKIAQFTVKSLFEASWADLYVDAAGNLDVPISWQVKTGTTTV